MKERKRDQLDSVWFGFGAAAWLYQTTDWMSAKSRAEVCDCSVVFKAVIYISAFGHLICLQLLMVQQVRVSSRMCRWHLKGPFFFSALTKWWKVAQGRGTWSHSGVSAAFPGTLSTCIWAECRWGLWPGREALSQKSVWWLIVADSDSPGRATC